MSNDTVMDMVEADEVEEVEGETKEDRFIRLANYRYKRLVKMIRQLKNLSNKNNYHYSPEQVHKIMSGLATELHNLEAAFNTAAPDELEDIL